MGEPRAGRTDLLAGLRRVLDPASTAARVDALDPYRGPEGDGVPGLTEVEVTLLELGATIEQELDPRLELLDPESGLPTEPDRVAQAVLGLRLCYRLEYDDVSGAGSHWVDYPRDSRPEHAQWARVPRGERALLPLLVLDKAAPLQLRAEGRLRALLRERDLAASEVALAALRDDVAAATARLSATPIVREAVREVLEAGAGLLLPTPGPNQEDRVSFQAEDGSLPALLRAIQPGLDLDAAGALPMRNHGSTASGVLAAAEAAAAASDPSAVVLADDFGDDLDASAAEYLAAVLRRRSGQLWLSTRRPEALRGFLDDELLRLTRRGGSRQQHQLPSATDRKDRAARRQLLPQLLAAITSPTIALLEGPHDLEGYGAVADRRLRVSGTPPPAAHGVRLAAPAGAEGGKDNLARLGALAGQLGFRVVVVVDGDASDTLVGRLLEVAETVVRLPDRVAVERVLTDGLSEDVVRSTLQDLSDSQGLGLAVGALGRVSRVERG